MIFKRLAVLPFALLIAAAPPAPVAAPIAGSAAAARVRSHVEFLADDLLEGRGTGTRGHEIAAAYVASQFRAMGLQPGGENGSWYQWVPLRRATLVAGKSSIAMTVDGKTAPVSEFDLGLTPSVLEKARAIDAGLVFAGYGLSDPALGIDDYAGLDVRGKIVVAFRGTPAGLPGDIAAHLGASKARIAGARGAVGMLFVSPRAPATASEAAKRSLYSTTPVTDWVDSAGKSGADGGAVRVDLLASRSMAEQLFAGAAKSLAAVRAEAAVVGARPRGFALKPTLSIRSESSWHDYKSPEVVGLLPGTDPRLKSEYVAMMGHLDHLGIKEGAKPGEDRIYNGALDNAAGVATLIEAARGFTGDAKGPRRSILFVVHTGEELGLLGIGLFRNPPDGADRADRRRGRSRHAGAALPVQRRGRVRRRSLDHRPSSGRRRQGDEHLGLARPDARPSDLHPVGPLSLRRARRARDPAVHRLWQWRQGQVRRFFR